MKQSKIAILLALTAIFVYSGNVMYESWSIYNGYVNEANVHGNLVRPNWMPTDTVSIAETRFYEYVDLAEEQGKHMLVDAFIFFVSAYLLSYYAVAFTKPQKKEEEV